MRHRFFLFIHGNSPAILNVDAKKLGRELVKANQKEDTATREIWCLASTNLGFDFGILR